MSGFENNVINNANALIRAAMHSPNYVTGVSGWTINKDGSAEFNNLSLRGTFNGNNWIMNADGLFFYNGPAATGNLSLAITNPNASGIDQYGNVYSPGGISIIALAGLANLFTIVDPSDNTLLSMDTSGDISGAIASFQDLNVGGYNLFNDILPPIPDGLIARGYVIAGANWPSVQISGETAILELDFTVPANRQYVLKLLPSTIIPTVSANTQHIHRFKYTTDGSTPTTASPQFANRSPYVTGVPTNLSTLNVPLITAEIFLPYATIDTLYRVLLTGQIQSGTFLYTASNTPLEMDVYDVGNANIANTGYQIGTGTSGGSGSVQTYTKTYYPTETHSYYGPTATYGSGPNGKRNDNGTMWQGCPNGGAFHEGDQISYARFNYTQIVNDIGSGNINWVKLRLTNLSSYYSSGMNVICGYSSYSGTFGDPFAPGSGTHMNQEHWHINQGQTLQHTMNPWIFSHLKTDFTTIVIGNSASYTNGTDLNNFGSFYGYTATPNPSTPQLQINYTK